MSATGKMVNSIQGPINTQATAVIRAGLSFCTHSQLRGNTI